MIKKPSKKNPSGDIKFKFKPLEGIRARRTKSGLNQKAFWAHFGVTQSSSSRYETGHSNIPNTVMALLNLTYPKRIMKEFNFDPLQKSVQNIRHDTGLTQSDFWTQLGVTQSGGSRYENGRPLPRTLRALINRKYPPKKARTPAK